MSQIRQIIYVSSSIQELAEEALHSLLVQARRNNEKNDVTGLLFYHLGIFLQVLEGPPEAIEQLFSKISDDSRHKRVIILLDEMLDSRDFENWRMGYANVKQNPPEGVVDLVDFYHKGNIDALKESRAKTVLISFKKTHSNSIL